MPEALMQPCAAAESALTRCVRYTATALLVLIALLEFALAGVMLSLQRATPQCVYLLCTLALFVSAVVAARERRRGLTAVRVCAIASAVTLVWASTSAPWTSFVAHGGRVRNMIPYLTGMLLVALLLPALMKQRDSEAACNCH